MPTPNFQREVSKEGEKAHTESSQQLGARSHSSRSQEADDKSEEEHPDDFDDKDKPKKPVLSLEPGQIAKVIQLQAYFRMKWAVESFERKRFTVMALQYTRRKFKRARDVSRVRRKNFQGIAILKSVVENAQRERLSEAMDLVKEYPAYLDKIIE